MRLGIFLPELAFSAVSPLTVSVQPPCAIACINICAHVKNPKHWQPYQRSGRTNILHTPTGMGSAALAAAVPYPGKPTRAPRKGQRSTLKKKKKNVCLLARLYMSVCMSVCHQLSVCLCLSASSYLSVCLSAISCGSVCVCLPAVICLAGCLPSAVGLSVSVCQPCGCSALGSFAFLGLVWFIARK